MIDWTLFELCLEVGWWYFKLSPEVALEYTPNANMADHSVIARDELHESEASEASVFCFDNASLKSFASWTV